MSSLRDLLARRLPGLWRGFFDAFVRDNKVLPPVVALLALFLFAWVVAGAFVNEPDRGAPGEADLVQSRNPADAAPVAPEAEDRDADSYAAYRNKDPFRQLLAQAEDTTDQTADDADDSFEETTDDTFDGTTTADPGETGGRSGGKNRGGGGNGSGRSRGDSDGDGVPTRREERLGLDPRNPDTDGDGLDDGVDTDADGDGFDDRAGGGGNGGGGNGGGGGAGGGGSGGGRAGSPAGNGGRDGSDDLFDSGGTLSPP